MIVTQWNRLCTNHNDRVRFLKCFLLKKSPPKWPACANALQPIWSEQTAP
jgi:hypothetical protein